jgi:hypothetical protein
MSYFGSNYRPARNAFANPEALWAEVERDEARGVGFSFDDFEDGHRAGAMDVEMTYDGIMEEGYEAPFNLDDLVAEHYEIGPLEMPERLWEVPKKDQELFPAVSQNPRLGTRGSFSTRELRDVTDALNRYRRENGLTKQDMGKLLDSTGLTGQYSMHAEKLYHALEAVLPMRHLPQSDLLKLVGHKFLTQAQMLVIPLAVKVSIMIHHRHLVVAEDWHELRKAIANNLAIPEVYRKNCCMRRGATDWLKKRFRGMSAVEDGIKAAPSGHSWLLGEIAELELLWHEQFCKCWAAARGSLENFKAGYTTHSSGWNHIGGKHSTRSPHECKMFWEVTHKYKHTGSAHRHKHTWSDHYKHYDLDTGSDHRHKHTGSDHYKHYGLDTESGHRYKHSGSDHRHKHTGSDHRYKHSGSDHRYRHSGSDHRHKHTGSDHKYKHTGSAEIWEI